MGCMGWGGLIPANPGAGLGSAGCTCCCACAWACICCMAASVVGGMKIWLVKVCVVIPGAPPTGLLSIAVVTAGWCGGGGAAAAGCAWCGGLCWTTTTAGSMCGASMSI